MNLSKKVLKNERTNTIVGTWQYHAPEIYNGNGFNYKIDYWAFGISLFNYLKMKCPYKDLDEMIFIFNNPDELDDLSFTFNDLDLYLDDSKIAFHCLEINPEDRSIDHSRLYTNEDWERIRNRQFEPPVNV